MDKKFFRRVIAIGSLLVMLIFVGMVYLGSNVGGQETEPISADVAVTSALDYAKDNGLHGGLIGAPTEIRGQIMTYKEASQLVVGRPPSSGTMESELADKRVWLVVLQGNIIEHVPAELGTDGVPAKDVEHNQMAIMVDAVTADILRRTMISPNRHLPVTDLALLSMPKEDVAIPTRLLIKNPSPEATLPPAR